MKKRTFCKLKRSLSRNLVYNLQTFRGLRQVHFCDFVANSAGKSFSTYQSTLTSQSSSLSWYLFVRLLHLSLKFRLPKMSSNETPSSTERFQLNLASFLTKSCSELNNDIIYFQFFKQYFNSFTFNLTFKVTSVYSLGKVHSKLLLNSKMAACVMKRPRSTFLVGVITLALLTISQHPLRYKQKVMLVVSSHVGNSKLEFASTIMLVTQSTRGISHFDFIPRRIQHKRFLKRTTKYYSNHDASYQLELYVLSCGDVHPNPGPTRRNVDNDNNNNPSLQSQEQRTTKLSVFYANARSIVNKIAKLKTEIASNSFDIIVLTETHLDSSITDAEIFGSEYCSYRKDHPRRPRGSQSGRYNVRGESLL